MIVNTEFAESVLNTERTKKMMKKVKIEEFTKKFNEEYNFIYDSYPAVVAGYDEAVDYFDECLKRKPKWFGNLLKEFNNYRQDFVSSDREEAAFMFAAESLEIIP